MGFSCHIHLTAVIRKTAQPPNYTVTVMPAGDEWKCDVCGKKAIWVVNEF